MFYYSWSQILISLHETRLMETIAITPVLLIGSALLLVFSGLHLVPSFRTSKNLRRVTYAAGLAFTGWVCALTLFGLHATIGTMAAVLETRSGAGRIWRPCSEVGIFINSTWARLPS